MYTVWLAKLTTRYSGSMALFRAFAVFLAITCVLSFWLGMGRPVHAEEICYPVPRPQIENNKVTLRVDHAVNSRFSHMPEAQLEILLAEANRVSMEHFGIELNFNQPETFDISKLFALRPNIADDEVMEWVYDFKRRNGDRDRLVADLLERLQANDAQLAEIFDYALPHLTAMLLGGRTQNLATALTETLLNRLGV